MIFIFFSSSIFIGSFLKKSFHRTIEMEITWRGVNRGVGGGEGGKGTENK